MLPTQNVQQILDSLALKYKEFNSILYLPEYLQLMNFHSLASLGAVSYSQGGAFGLHTHFSAILETPGNTASPFLRRCKRRPLGAPSRVYHRREDSGPFLCFQEHE